MAVHTIIQPFCSHQSINHINQSHQSITSINHIDQSITTIHLFFGDASNRPNLDLFSLKTSKL